MSVNAKNMLGRILINIKNRPKGEGRAEASPYESCIMCGAQTYVRKDTPIEFRDCYEIGLGQLCYHCHRMLNGEPSVGSDEMKQP